MKVIGKRISILKKDKLLSIVILPTDDNRKLVMMFFWLLAWTVCGLIVLLNYFRMQDAGSKLFIIIYLAFWAYFEFSILRAFIWKKFGREKLWIQDNVLRYQREVNKKGKIREFNLDLISRFRIIELSKTKLADTINQSFWVKGGERLEFDAQSRLIRLGMQLSDEEARLVLNEVNAFMK
ncbi:MAG TPA: hypothetical protein PL029_06990 [Bacteroidia bacterium]|nr:hypothetical protein [Bacteroidia bacterium]